MIKYKFNVEKKYKRVIFAQDFGIIRKNLRRREAVPKCLGIYIEDDIIKYAKVDKNKDSLKIESSSVVFYEKENIMQTLDKIIGETFSAKDMISINVSNELYNYFEVFSALKLNDRKKSINLDFELLCSEKGYNKDLLDERFIFRDSKENADKMKVIHISANKENIRKRIQDFGTAKVVTVSPISTSIFNLVDLGPKDENVVIVNIENDTKVTTVIGGKIYHIDVIPEGMGTILNSINSVENSMQKSYECCKNTTIYTQDMRDLQIEANEHLEDIMPVLYKIVEEVRKISEAAIGQVTKVYITGLGTAINNIDLYFQEYIPNSKCELLKPFFLENNNSIKIPIKDYIEVNSAIALALDGLGYGESELNFRGKKSVGAGSAGISFDSKKIMAALSTVLDPKKELEAIDKTLLRFATCLCIGVVGYGIFSNIVINKIVEKKEDITKATQTISSEISEIDADILKINNGKSSYDSLISTLTTLNTPEEPEDVTNPDNDTETEEKEEVVIAKNAIPNLLNRIVYVIPTKVKITSIKNTENNHIVIEAQASKYDQLGYFRAALSTNGILDNVKSTSGTKSGDTVLITIEGDLP